MRGINKIIITGLSILLLSACEVNVIEDTIDFYSTDLSQIKNITVGSESTVYDLNFTAGGRWSAQIDDKAASWCSIDTENGMRGENSIKITINENETYEERNAAITLKCGSTSKVFTVIQKQKNALIIETSKIEASEKGGKFYVTYRTNCDVHAEVVDNCEWIHIGSVSTKGINNNALFITVDANLDTEKREGNILLTSGDMFEIVTVYQAKGTEMVLLSKADFLVASMGETIIVDVKTNTTYDYTILDSWISEVKTKAVSSYTHYFNVQANESYDSRIGKIVFTNKATEHKDTLSVLQLQKDALLLDSSNIEVPAEGGDYDISFKTNLEVSASFAEECDWIEFHWTKTKGLSDESIHIHVDGNFETIEREAKILLSSGTITDTIFISQAKGMEMVLLAQREYTVPAEGGTICADVKTNTTYEYHILTTWIREVKTKVLNEYTHYFTVDCNDGFDSRDGYVVFINKANDQKDTMIVHQLQMEAIQPLKDEYEVSYEEQTLSIDLGANIDVNVSVQANWISFTGIAKTKGMEDMTACFHIQENRSLEDRTATVTFQGNMIKKTVTVTQKHPVPMEVILEHRETTLPFLFVGYYTGVYGTVDWGDGTYYSGIYQNGEMHKYENDSAKTTHFVFLDAGGFGIKALNTISKITILTE